MARKFVFSPGEYYHLYTRGVERRDIFSSHNDYVRLIALLFASNSKRKIQLSDFKNIADVFEQERGDTLVDIGAYCLMTNHLHLSVKEKTTGGISEFTQRFLTAYSMFFNKKYQRSGSLFTRPFRAQHVDTDEHLKYLFAYIHLNPLKILDSHWKENDVDYEKAKKYLDSYQYSSYLDYASVKPRLESVILNKSAFPEYFSSTNDFLKEMREWILFPQD